MARTPDRTRLQDFIVTSGDAIVGEDSTTAGGSGTSIPITAGDNPVVAASGMGGSIVLTAGSVTDGGSSGNAGSVVLTPGIAAGSGSDGVVTIGGSSALQFTETASVPGALIAAGEGRIWVRSDSPNVLVFTDDTGTDTALGGATRLAQNGVVTDDLRFFVDFNNQSSWTPNQTTIWTDTIAALGGTATATTITNGHLNFDGATSVVDFGTLSTALEDIFAGGGTVVAWVRPESDGENNTGRIIDTSQGTLTEGWSLYVRDEAGGNLQYALQAGTTVGGPNNWETTDNYPIGAWTFVAITFDSDNVGTAPLIYINGTAVAVSVLTDTGTNYGSDAGNDLLVGNRTGDDRTFDGDVEMVGLYDTTKTAAEIRDIYRAQSTRFGSLAAGISTARAETVQVLGGTSGTTALPGGDVEIRAGTNAAGVGSGRGGNLTLSAGDAGSNSGVGGSVSISAGAVSNNANADGGDITITAGNASTTQGLGGSVTIMGGNTFGASTLGGPITLKGGLGSPLTGRGGLVTVEGGDGNDGGGDVEINGGQTTGTFQSRMGNVTLQGGQPTGNGGFFESGNVFVLGGTRFASDQNQRGGAVTVTAGSTGASNADGPDVSITAGNTNGFNQRHGGDVFVTAGDEEGNGSGTSSGGDIVLTPGTTVAGGVSRAGKVQILGSGTLELAERTAALITPAGGRGYVWLRNDTPNVLVFTDDTGADFVVGGVGASQNLSSVLSVGNTTGGTDVVMSSGDDLAGVDSAVADATGFIIRGGDFTGGAGDFDGGSIIIQGGGSNGSVNGLRAGDVTVRGGAITGTAGGTTRAGDVFIVGGDASGGGGLSDGGNVAITGGASTDQPGDVTITGGASSSVTGGDVTIRSGEGAANGTGGAVLITTDSGASGTFTYGSITIQTPDATLGNNEISGNITIQAGQNGTRNVPGSDVIITAGDSNAGGANRAGDVVITAGDQVNGTTGGDGGDIFLNPGTSANANAGIVDINGDVDISGDCDIAGKLTVVGGIDPSYLGLNEQGTTPFTPTAGIGFFWVDSTVSPHRFVLTDEAGDDVFISCASGLTCAGMATTLAGGDGTGTSGFAAQVIGGTGDSTFDGGDVLLQVGLAGSGGSDGRVVVNDGSGAERMAVVVEPLKVTMQGADSLVAGNSGTDVALLGGAGLTTGDGGNVVLQPGPGGATGVDGGVQYNDANGNLSGTIYAKFADFTIQGDSGASPGDQGVDLFLTAGDGNTTGKGGDVVVTTGTSPSGTEGRVILSTNVVEPQPAALVEFTMVIPSVGSGDGNDFRLEAASTTDAGMDGGDLFLTTGGGGAGGADGVIWCEARYTTFTPGPGDSTETARIYTPGSFSVKLEGGNAVAASGDDGFSVTVGGGAGDGVGDGGSLFFEPGVEGASGSVGHLHFELHPTGSAGGSEVRFVDAGVTQSWVTVTSGSSTLETASSTTGSGVTFNLTGGSHTGASASDFDGASLNVTAGSTNSTNASARGGDVFVRAGDSTGAGGGSEGGIELLGAGATASTEPAGNIRAAASPSSTAGGGSWTVSPGGAVGGDVTITGGSGISGATAGGAVALTSGDASGAANAGAITLLSGDGSGTAGSNGGLLLLRSGNGAGPGGGSGGGITLITGDGALGSGNGGAFSLTTGGGGTTTANGGDVTVTAGDGGATSGDGGSIALLAGGVTSGTNGDITMFTQGTDAPVGIRTSSDFVGTEDEHLTFGDQVTAPSGAGFTTIVTLGSVTTAGRNMKFDVWVTAQDNSTSSNFVSVKIAQSCYRDGTALNLVTAHQLDEQGNGATFLSDLSFTLAVSGTDDIILRVQNTSSTVTYTINTAVRWTRQEGGFTS